MGAGVGEVFVSEATVGVEVDDAVARLEPAEGPSPPVAGDRAVTDEGDAAELDALEHVDVSREAQPHAVSGEVFDELPCVPVDEDVVDFPEVDGLFGREEVLCTDGQDRDMGDDGEVP